jgi:hypothetical protein
VHLLLQMMREAIGQMVNFRVASQLEERRAYAIKEFGWPMRENSGKSETLRFCRYR